MSEAERLADELDDTPNWQKEKWGSQWKHSTMTYSRVPFEAAAELRRLSAELAALKAAMGKPVAWWYDVGGKVHLETTRLDYYYVKNGEYIKGRPLVFAEAQQVQQAKPQPLSREQVKGLCESAGYNLASPTQQEADFINGIRHAEAAHGITKE